MNMKQSILIFLILSFPICGYPLTVTIDSIVPNPFSPNGDGMLDSAKIYCTVSDTHTLRVYRFFGDPIVTDWIIGPFSAGSYTYSWGGAGYPSGTYRTYIFARDTSGVDYLSADSYITIDLQKPFISNVSASPNPFSPDGDGRNDVTHIKFTLSEPCSMTIVFEGAPADTHTGFYDSGANDFTWDGAGYFDGTYKFTIDARDVAGCPADQVDGEVTIDTKPANIYNVSVSPNPFTPDDDGITDYCYIDFCCDSTHPAEWDSVFAPDSILGYIVIQPDTSHLYTPLHTFPPFPVYLYLAPEDGYDRAITVTLTDFSDIDVATQIPALSGPTDTYRVGVLTNKFIDVWVKKVTGGLPGDSIRVYCFTGNATITIYNEDGSPQGTNWNFWEEFRGDGCYRGIWGPGPIADGKYIYRIVVEDEAASLIEESGIIIANSTPIYISDVSANPTTISPSDTNYLYDVSTISYKISELGIITIRVYNSPTVFDSTTLVRTLLDGIEQTEGAHSVDFDGKDDSNDFLAQNSCSTYTYVISVVDPITSDANQATGDITVDNLLPDPPNVFQPTTPTNQTAITVEGGAEKGVFVELFVNGSSIGTTTADGISGAFSFTDVALTEGTNWIYGTAIDSVCNVSAPSDTKDVFLDATDPVVSLVFPLDGSFRNDSIFGSVYAVISDGALGCGIDLNGSNITVLGVPGNVVRQAPDTLVYVFTDTLKDTVGNIYDGTYTIQVTPVDSVGNNTTYTFSFLYDTKEPTSSPSPPDSAFVNQLNSVSAVISDDGSGVDIDNSFIFLMDSDTNFVPGSTSDDGVSEVFYTPDPPLDTLGFEDGRYYIQVEAWDNANNVDSMFTTLIYDTRAPRVAWSYPKEDTAVGSPIYKVKVVVTDSSDVSPGIAVSGRDFSKSSIRLLREDYSVVPGTKTTSGDTLIWELTDSLDIDGKYYIYTKLYDNASNFSENYIGFYYDAQNPVITKVIPSDGANVRTQISEVKATLYDAGSGIDTGSSLIRLLRADSTVVPGNQSTKSDTIIWTLLNPLTTDGTDDGRYYVAVEAYDMAGWSENDMTTFIYDTRPPVVDSTIPKDAVWVNASSFNDTVYAAVRDTISDIAVSGIDTLASTIRLLKGATGFPGIQSNSGDSLLIWALSAGLATDGTDDGEYTIKVNLKDNAGNSSTITNKFNYDTQPPGAPTLTISPPSGQTQVKDNDIITVGGSTEANASLDTVYMYEYSDTTKTTKVDSSAVTGVSISADGTISGSVNIGTLNASAKSISLCVVVEDGAGHTSSVGESNLLFVDIYNPTIVSVNPADGADVNTQVTEVKAVLKDIGTNIDFSSSTIRLTGEPGTQSVAGDTIIWNLTYPFATDGSDDGSHEIVIYAVDNAGNDTTDTTNFVYDTRPPWVLSTNPAGNATVTDTIDTVYAIVSDSVFGVSAWSGINFFLSETNLLREDDTKVPGSGATNGDTLFWVLNTSLDVDGNYKLRTILWDNATNCDTLISSFVYDLSDPVVKSMLPQGNVNVLDTVVAVVADLGSGIDFDSTTIVLERIRGVSVDTVSGATSNDGDSTVYFVPDPHLDKNGADDGQYRINVNLFDKTGRTVYDSLSFIYDTWLPSLASYYPADSLVSSPLTEVWVVPTDTNPIPDITESGIDFGRSSVRLFQSDSTTVVGGYQSTSADTIRWTLLDTLSGDGKYVLFTKLIDNAGNCDTVYIDFTYDLDGPVVKRVIPQDNSFVNELELVEAVVADYGTGVNFDSSTIVLEGPFGIVSDSMWNDGDSTIYFSPDPKLDKNGAHDDKYWVYVTVSDGVGHTASDTSSLIYDTWLPSIDTTYPYQNELVGTPLNSVYAVLSDTNPVTDSVSGVDFIFSMVELYGPDGNRVPGSKSVSGDTIKWTMSSPPEVDGDYQIKVKKYDRAKNADTTYVPFSYDIHNPYIVWPLGFSNTFVSIRLRDVTGGGGISAADIEVINPHDEYLTMWDEPLTFQGDTATIKSYFLVPLKTNGADDGRYTVLIYGWDHAGHTLVPQPDTCYVSYDNIAPFIISSDPDSGAVGYHIGDSVGCYISDKFAGVQFTSGIWFDSCDICLKYSNGTGVPGWDTYIDNGDGTGYLWWHIDSETNLPEDNYTMEVAVIDHSRNRKLYVIPFEGTSAVPEVIATVPPDGGATDSLTSIEVLIKDYTGTGTDTIATSVSLVGPDGPVPSSFSGLKSGTVDTLVYSVDTTLATDGSDDGSFTITAIPYAVNGKYGEIYQSTFIYDTQEPVVKSITPQNGSFVNSLTSMSSVIYDQFSGIDFNTSTVSLRGPIGTVPGDLANDGDSVISFTPSPPLETNGGDDGKYTITVTAYDRAAHSSADSATIIYDTWLPWVSEAYPAQDDIVGTPLSFVYAVITDLNPNTPDISGIDTLKSWIKLYDWNEEVVPGSMVISGDTIRWEFPPLTDDGAYTTKIKIFDLAGNSNTIDVPFYYDLTAPYVAYTTPANHSNITTEVSEVTAIIRDPGGAGINFSPSVTYVELINPYSQLLPGELSNDGDSTLTFALLNPLLDDGSKDGSYKILVYAEDSTGRPLTPTNPDTNYFIYDNIESSITESEPDSGEMIDTLVWVDVSDIFPGVDSISGIDFNASTISLIGPSGKGVPGYQVNLPGAGDRTGTLQYKISPGSEILTGWYQIVVHLPDKAGNITDSTISFYGISRIPDVVSTVPEEGDFVNYLDEVKALIDRKDLAIDTSLSVIQIAGADTVISETKSLVGDTLKLNFAPLPQDGSMDDEWVITVTPVAGGKTGTTKNVHFVYDTRPPYITAFVPLPNDTIGHNWPQIIVTVEDSSLSGVDFDASTVNLFDTLWNPVAGTQSTDYVNKIYFTLSSPLSDTGWYHIVANISDRAGNTRADTSDFYFTTAILPEIVRTIPLEDTVQYQLTEVACLLISNSGQPINKLTSTIYLVDTSSDTIPGSRVWSGDTIRWVLSTPLADDGSDNGLYTVLVHAVDEKPCITDGSFGFLYLYDAVPPGMPYLVTLVPDTTSEGIIDTLKGCAEPLSQVKLLNVFNDSIIHSDSVIAAGDSSFTFLDIPLLTGINTLKLTATDVFGNASDTLIKIIYQFPQPLIISTYPAEDTTITEQLTRIYAIVEDTISGIDEDSSTIVLLNSVNDTIPGSKSWSGDTMIIYTLTPSLVNDGTADGNYNVSMKIVNQAKVPRYRDYSFTYICDEVPPELWVGVLLCRIP